MGLNMKRSPQSDSDNPFGEDGRPPPGGVEEYLQSLYSAAQGTSTVSQTDVDAASTSIALDQSNTATLDLGSQSTVIDFTVTQTGTSLPTTFATATPSQSLNTTPAGASSSSTLSTQESDNDDGGLSDGELAAAIVVPIVVSLALIALAFILLRRRSKRAPLRHSAYGPKTGFFGGGLKEKWGSLRSSASSRKSSTDRPVFTAHSNDAYMTGLDTSSHAGASPEATNGEHSNGHKWRDAPPPYLVRKDTSMSRASQAPSIPPLDSNLAVISMPNSPRTSMSHEMSHMSPVSPIDNAHLAPPTPGFLDPPQSSGRSARSINSDVYSDTASIHSARAARMSVGGPIFVTPAHNVSGENPFHDPATPVPSIPGDARRPSDGGR